MSDWCLIPPGTARLLEPGELEILLAGATQLSETDSCMCGPIRLLELSCAPGEHWIQEQDLQRRPLLRRLSPGESGEAFIAARLDTYERMWDG